jgi:hypothetical protein
MLYVQKYFFAISRPLTNIFPPPLFGSSIFLFSSFPLGVLAELSGLNAPAAAAGLLVEVVWRDRPKPTALLETAESLKAGVLSMLVVVLLLLVLVLVVLLLVLLLLLVC